VAPAFSTKQTSATRHPNTSASARRSRISRGCISPRCSPSCRRRA
jgi:hypothetical protein